MNRKLIVRSIAWLAALFVVVSMYAEEWVKFEGMPEAGGKLQLTGILSVPEGNGPFPAVVMLCGAGGLKNKNDAKQQKAWAERLANWGYVSLRVDSFGPRNYEDIRGNLLLVNQIKRSLDAYSAKAYLANLRFVDAENIAVIGWSHGGGAIMTVVDGMFRDENTKPFQAAIAFYPPCESLTMFDTPLLILIGEKDNACPAIQCESLKDADEVKDSTAEFKLIIYPDVHHSFDFEGLMEDSYGIHAEYNPEATADAIQQTKDFLAKYLK